MIFCTLFDSNYLDKGIVLYKSLNNCTNEFKLYVVCMDDISYSILRQMNLDSLYPIKLSDFMTEELKIARMNRSRAEFCWTCSSCSIEYVLDKYKESICTYIDADMYFYSNPKCLFDELGDNSIGIIEHRNNDNMEGRYYEKIAGPYCVEFNTFRNDARGRKALSWWKEQCLNCCSADTNGKTFGDQKYLEDWPARFDGVHIYSNPGAGIAPWNISQYKYTKDNNITINGKIITPIFYHFHAMEYINDEKVNIHVFYRNFMTDSRLVNWFYVDYLKKINHERLTLGNDYKLSFRTENKSKKGGLKQKLFRRCSFREILVAINVRIRMAVMNKKDIVRC